MKKNIVNKLLSLSVSGLLSLSVAVGFTGCKDYLTEQEPGVTMLADFFGSKEAAVQCVTGCYVPLMWEYNSTYYSEWFIGDIVSDDALKGGQNTNDMSASFDMENWQTTASNQILLDFYRAQYQGIARCNVALQNIPNMATDTAFSVSLKNRLLGEAYFLRGYYYFRLLRVFGGVPMVTKVINSESDWIQPRASVSEMFTQIKSDFAQANKYLWLRSKLEDAEVGRATKGAAQAMLLKTNLYEASPYWNGKVSENATDLYKAAKAWGDSIIASNEYMLVDSADYQKMFALEGENGKESIFEIQYMEVPWGDYGEGNGFTAGSFTQVLVRSRNSKIGGGWGFNHPTWNLYNEYEVGDPRRDIAILRPTSFENEVEETYLGSPLLNRKYGMYDNPNEGGGFGQWGLHASRGPLNNKQIRYADVLLMYAEACIGAGDNASAQNALNEVRTRLSLPTYPGYSITVNGTAIASPSLEEALRHERRMELAMEGHRWFDLVRWGKTKEHMDAYAATESVEAKNQMRTFIAGKHEIFPLPAEELELNPALVQNDNY